jgi:hypothetical protein
MTRLSREGKPALSPPGQYRLLQSRESLRRGDPEPASFIIFTPTNKGFGVIYQFSLAAEILVGVQAVVVFSFVIKRIGSH